jgi:ubiquinone/menaquinone biosynthesis C-methylase UbiE
MPTFWQDRPEIMGPSTRDTFWTFTQRATLELVTRFILEKQFTSVLDVGSSTGIVGCAILSAGFKGKYCGVDNNEKAVIIGRKNLEGLNAEMFAYDAEKMDFPDKSFDVVFIKGLIEHAAYYEEIIKESLRVCKKHFILSMFIKPTSAPDKINLQPQGYHLNHYNNEKLFSFIEKFGFRKSMLLYEDRIDIVLTWERN